MFGIGISILVLAICLYLLWRGKQMRVFKELGIPGPEPNLIFGNLIEIFRKGTLRTYSDWFKKYGKVVGCYVFSLPIILVADADILKRIQISDFHKFPNRTFSVNPSKDQKGGDLLLQLINYRDKRWKDIRSILTPSFTTSKMRGMAPIMNDSIDTLVDKIGEKAKRNEPFDIHKFYQGLTMDVIGRTAFGIKANSQVDKNDPFLKSARVLLSADISSILFMLTVSFPSLLPKKYYKILSYILTFGKDANKELFNSIRAVIHARKQQPGVKRQDLLQLMMDAKMSEEDLAKVKGSELTAGLDETIEENEQPEVNNEDKYKSGKILRHMDEEEIVDNAAVFFLAGYETSSSTLAYVTHLLIYHPEVQDKMREEINELMKTEGKLDYTAVSKLQYMEQVIDESLRMYPPVYSFVSREASEDTDFGAFKVKKGMAIIVPAYHIHRDPDYWEDPNTFKPERWAPENKSKINSVAFQAFGAGPRNCVGMRFAYMEMKLALAKILQKYKLVKCAESDGFVPEIKQGPVLLQLKNGVVLKAVPI